MRRTVFSLVLSLTVVTGCGSPDQVPEIEGDAVVWTSPDGMTWSRVASPEVAGAGDQQMTGITQHGDQLVAVGFERLDGEIDGRAWLSTDGVNWREAGLPGDGENWVWAVASDGDMIIAVGESLIGDDNDASIWISGDGSSWSLVEDPNLSGAGYSGLRSVVVYEGMILVGGGLEDTSAVWTSKDGSSWSEPIILEGGLSSVGLFAGMNTVYAVGSDEVDGVMWESVDGENWAKLDNSAFAGDGYQTLTAMEAGPAGLVTVGFEHVYEEIFYMGRGDVTSADAAVWLSGDDGWARVDDPIALEGLGDQQIYGITAWGSTLVAVGIDSSDPRVELGEEFDSGANVDGAVWLSDDGRIWSRVRSASFGGENWQDILDVIPFDDQLIAVGGDDAGS